MDAAKRRAWSRRGFLTASLLLPQAYRLLGQQPASRSVPRFLNYDEVAAVLASGRVSLPAELAMRTAAERRTQWPAWIQDHDREIRARLTRGEEDTLVNFVMFGVSFTRQPRIAAEVTVFDPENPVFVGRIQDFVAAVSAPGKDDRLLMLRRLLKTLGYDTTTAERRERIAGYVEESLRRYIVERAGFEQTVRRALANDTASLHAATAHLYRDRGLSLDTDFRPNYSIERGLAEARRRGLLTSVRRVAIVGPGLDFTDKNAGFDHYPLQSLQPFALVDSLLRLGLSELANLQVTLFDISAPVLEHLSDAVARAKSGQPYSLQLILDRTPNWNREAIDYWGTIGSRIGSAVAPLPAPQGAASLERRAVRVLPGVVTALQPMSLNVVAQTLNLPEDQRFDLVVATNVFVYYEPYEQALALLSLQSMLASRGIVLTNDLFESFPVRLQTVGSLQVNFSPSSADQVQILSTPAFRPQLAPQ